MISIIGHRNEPCWFYQFYNPETKFYSIGITRKTPKERKRDYKQHKNSIILTEILFDNYYTAYNFEQRIKHEYSCLDCFKQIGNSENYIFLS